MKRLMFPLIMLVIFMVVWFISPEAGQRSAAAAWDYIREMVLILPPVFMLMGLLEIWLPKKSIQKWLGNDSGLYGAVISLVLGTLPTGPLYIAFPLAASLLKKGASIANIVIFLGAWAALKIPQLMVEMQFLGLAFTAARFVLTLIALAVMGNVIKLALRGHRPESWE
jgi:uncharacterized membrane protein YraQ (UPF0718 family)